MNKVEEARALLEAHKQGYFAEVIEYTLRLNGVLHASPDCFLCAVPCEDKPEVLHVIFQASRLDALHAVLLALQSYKRVRYCRDGRGDGRWREIDISRYARKLNLYTQYLNHE